MDNVVEVTASQEWILEQSGKFADLQGYMGGKTYGGLLKIDYEAAENKIAVAKNEKEGLYKGKNSSWLVVEPVSSMIDSVLIPKIDEFCRNMGYNWEFIKKSKPTDIQIDAHGYSYILYLRSAQNYMRWEGMQGTIDYPILGGWIDEGASIDYPAMWEYFVRRVTRFNTNAIRFITSTPPVPQMRTYSGGDNYWIYKKIDNIHEGTTMENVFMPDAKGYAEQIEMEVGELLAQALVYGKKVVTTAGKLFWAFNVDKHVISDMPFDYNRLKNINLVFDFNIRPMSCFACQIFDGVIYIFKFWRAYGLNTRLFMNEILGSGFLKTFNGGIEVYGDPSGKRSVTSGDTSETMQATLSDYDIIMDVLKKHKKKADLRAASVAPTVSASADVVNIAFTKGIIKIYNKDKEHIELVLDLKEEPNESKERDRWKLNYSDRSHYSDCLRYLVFALFGDVRSFNNEYRQLVYNRMSA